MKIKNNKSQELSMNTLIMIIVLVVSFAIILFLLLELNFSGQINQQTCYNSVTLKKTIGDKPIGGKWVDVPLKCKTEDICLTTGSGDNTNCDTLLGKDYTKISVSSENDIYQFAAGSLAKCWSTMGESKGGMVFSREFALFSQTSNGVICSIIGFSDNLKKKYPELSTLKFYNYMNTEKVPEKTITYSQYLSNINNPTVIPLSVASQDVLDDKKIPTSQPYTIVFVEYERTLLGVRSSAVAGTAAGTILGAGAAGAIYGSIVPVAGNIVGAAVGATVGAVIAVGSGIIAAKADDKLVDYYTKNPERYYSSTYLKPYNAAELTSLHITNFQSIS